MFVKEKDSKLRIAQIYVDYIVFGGMCEQAIFDSRIRPKVGWYPLSKGSVNYSTNDELGVVDWIS